MPNAGEILAQMTDAKFFTKLDASNAFWQVKLDEESSKLLTFNTPFGRYNIYACHMVFIRQVEFAKPQYLKLLVGCNELPIAKMTL